MNLPKRRKRNHQQNIHISWLFLYHHGHYSGSHKLISFSLQFTLGLLSPAVFFSSAFWLVPQLNQNMHAEKAFPSSAPNLVYFAASVFLYPKDWYILIYVFVFDNFLCCKQQSSVQETEEVTFPAPSYLLLTVTPETDKPPSISPSLFSDANS